MLAFPELDSESDLDHLNELVAPVERFFMEQGNTITKADKCQGLQNTFYDMEIVFFSKAIHIKNVFMPLLPLE